MASDLWARVSRPWAGSARVARPDASPVVLRRVDGCLVIEVRGAVGPAAEARLGRVLHAAIRAGGTGVRVDLPDTRDLGASGDSVLQLAHMLAEQRGVPFDVARVEQPAPQPPRAAQELLVLPE
ncbi:hypothetical protein [Streptomyces sp. NPDC055060]